MGLFGFGDKAPELVDAVGGAVTGTIDSINYALSGDLPPEVRVKLKETKLKMMELEGKIMEGQVAINKIEASSTNLFKSSWRPALAWVGVTGFSLVFVIFPIAEWVLNIFIAFKKIDLSPEEIIALKPPIIDAMLLMNLLGALLGVGTLRTYEKNKGLTK